MTIQHLGLKGKQQGLSDYTLLLTKIASGTKDGKAKNKRIAHFERYAYLSIVFIIPEKIPAI